MDKFVLVNSKDSIVEEDDELFLSERLTKEELLKVLAEELGYQLIKNDDIKFCWMNTDTGDFSNSWDLETQLEHDPLGTLHDGNDCSKLIRYSCDNDKDFEFRYTMKLMTKHEGIVEINGKKIKGTYLYLDANTIKFFPITGDPSFTAHYKSLI